MISKVTSAYLAEPVVYHERLHTKFNGTVHPLSTQEAPVHQYRGIKYATVPARFRQSKLCTTYSPVTDATQYGPICPQPGRKGYEEELFNVSEGSIPIQTLKQDEFECLNLNITCPADASPDTLYPVMVFVHGGGNRGSGSSWLYDGGALVQRSIIQGKPIILVTINYRIGLLGCAASQMLREDNVLAGDEGVGNYGLRDQRKALEWIHSFISTFGGDPSNVTLCGVGTGAADILCHMHSAANETHPLFQRAIVQSPTLESEIPNVSTAGWQLNRLASAFQAHTVEDLRSVPVEKLVACTPHFRAVDDGVFFAKGWREALYPEHQDSASHDQRTVPDLLSQHLKPRSRSSQRSGSRSRSRSRARHIHNTNLYHHISHLQPMMVGDCGAESLAWSGPASLWSAPGVVRRIRAICQSMTKSSALLRAYDISSHTPADELPEHVLDLINDARFAWPTDCVANTAKRARGGRGVWRYVFDQESPSKGTPHHGVDIQYLFDNVPLKETTSLVPPETFSPELTPSDDDDPMSLSPSPPSTPPLSYGSDTDSDGVDFGFGFSAEDDDWGVPIVDEWTYTRVRDAVQSRWLAFAYGEAPWSEDKVYVFGPEGETGERSMNIFAGRRRLGAWQEALEPLGMRLAQKVGIELSNGPPFSS